MRVVRLYVESFIIYPNAETGKKDQFFLKLEIFFLNQGGMKNKMRVVRLYVESFIFYSNAELGKKINFREG